MTATKPLDMPLPFVLKQEKKDNPSENDDSEDDNEETDSDSVSSLSQPSILDKNSLNDVHPRNEYLQLQSMVRRVYFSYLHKSILNNYNVCCKTKEIRDVSRVELKKFASQMELHAVRASLEASLYRQAMLKMISDVKTSTSRQKVDKKLSIFLQTPPSTVDAAVQTCDHLLLPEIKVFAPIGEKVTDKRAKVDTLVDQVDRSLDDRLAHLFSPPVINPKDLYDQRNQTDEKNPHVSAVKKEPMEMKKIEVEQTEKIETDDKEVMINILHTNLNVPNDEDQVSQDSLMQHLEDMFCESDDSSDLTTLIERHSGVTKTNVDKEIRKMCPEAVLPVKNCNFTKSMLIKGSNLSIATPPMSLSQEASSSSGTKRKLTLSSYKTKKRALESGEEDKETKKMRGIWLVEKIHQVSKLKAKLMELSVRNYRKHGRIRNRLTELFGDDDGEDLAPDSPVRIEDHLTWCKERIAPWVVKYLMPFYSKKVINDRLLFKAVAKHITDLLIIDNTFPEEEYVNQYIKDYFRNKPKIKSQADIYM